MIGLPLFCFVGQLAFHFLLVEGNPTIQCVQTGAAFKTLPLDYIRWNWRVRPGGFTIGAEKFDSNYGGAMASVWITYSTFADLFKHNSSSPEKLDCPYTWNTLSTHEVQLCDEQDSRVKLSVNAVQQTDASGKNYTLTGWLHIEVELVNTSDSIRMVYAQMYDEYYNAIGEFVTDPKEQCRASDPDKFVDPTPYQYLPCSAIGAREEKASQALYMVHSEDYVDKSLNGSKYLPKQELNRGVHFTWRINEYWCSRHQRIIPMVFILTKYNLENWKTTTNHGNIPDSNFGQVQKQGDWKMYRKILNYWFLPGWIGASDIRHPERGPLQCNNPILEGTGFNETLTKKAPWIRDLYMHKVTDEYYHYKNLYTVAEIKGFVVKGAITCQQNPYFIANYSHFVGRCLLYQDKNKRTNHSFHQTCNTNASAPEFDGLKVNFTIYRNYTADLTSNRSLTCSNPCRGPQTVEDAIDISNTVDPVTNTTEGYTYGLTHISRSRTGIARFWRGRKFHGVLCLIVTMFLMPISTFMTRYYKETFMDYQYHGVHIWYWVHFGASLTSLGFLVCGQIALAKGIESWGRSQNLFGVAHHSVGWTSILVFCFMMLLGTMRNAKRKWLKVLLRSHSIVGFTLYIFNLIQIALSIYIPASPSLRRCDRDGLPTGFSPTLYIAMGWAGLDLVFHGFLTTLQMTADRTLMGRLRPMYCPIMPILSPHSFKDFKRAGLRKVLLLLYIIVSTVFTLAATLHLWLRYQPEGCSIGEMSCKAALGCTPVGISMCKKLKYDICTKKGFKVVLH